MCEDRATVKVRCKAHPVPESGRAGSNLGHVCSATACPSVSKGDHRPTGPSHRSSLPVSPCARIQGWHGVCRGRVAVRVIDDARLKSKVYGTELAIAEPDSEQEGEARDEGGKEARRVRKEAYLHTAEMERLASPAHRGMVIIS